MKKRMLVVIGMLATAGTTAMLAEGCPVPRVPGFVFHALNVKGISCAEGSGLAQQTMKMGYGKYPGGWSCTTKMSGRNQSYSCDATGNPAKHYDFNYSVQ